MAMRLAGWLFLLCFFAASALSQESDAKKLLETTAQRYDQAKALLMEGSITTLTKSPSTEVNNVLFFTITIQKPNKFRLVLKDGQGKIQQVLVSDGTNMFIEVHTLKQVMKRPAPKSGVPLPGGGVLTGAMKKQLAKVKEAKIIGEEKLGQRKAKVIKVVTEDGTTAFLWVADNMLLKTKATVEGSRFAGKSPSDKPNPFLESLKQTTITQIVSFSKVTFNPKLAPNAFTYKPPADFKVVEGDKPAP